MASPREQIMHWLRTAAITGASDLHLVPNHPPTMRIHGALESLEDNPASAEFLRTGLLSLCPDEARERFAQQKNVDFALHLDMPQEGESSSKSVDGNHEAFRFRVNYFIADENIGACFRVIPSTIPDFSWASFPEQLATRLARFRNGLILITGVTGAGKTTTLAMIINLLNQAGGYRIITIEDPIEYQFNNVSTSIVTQREVGPDVTSFADGLKYGLRQDPDVILVGEIRDHETAQIALSAAETGHLVFSTIHTRDSKGAISRFTDLFSLNMQPEIRAQLAMSLRAVVSQQLLPSSLPGKRQLALETMFNTNPIASAIRQGKLESIDTGIVTGRASGMMTMDESIRRLLSEGAITRETAEYFSTGG